MGKEKKSAESLRQDRAWQQRSALSLQGPVPRGTEQGSRGARRHATAQGHAGQSRAAEEQSLLMLVTLKKGVYGKTDAERSVYVPADG